MSDVGLFRTTIGIESVVRPIPRSSESVRWKGLNLRVDPLRKQLVDAGPILAVAAA